MDTIVELLCTREDALKLIRKSRRERAHWALSVRLDARIADKPEHYFEDGLAHWLNITRQQAAALVKGMLSETLEGRGARIRIQKRTPAPCGTYQAPTTYWITQ